MQYHFTVYLQYTRCPASFEQAPICHKCRIHRWILEHTILFQTIGYGRTGKLAFIVWFPLSNTTCGPSADVSITLIFMRSYIFNCILLDCFTIIRFNCIHNDSSINHICIMRWYNMELYYLHALQNTSQDLLCYQVLNCCLEKEMAANPFSVVV